MIEIIKEKQKIEIITVLMILMLVNPDKASKYLIFYELSEKLIDKK